MDLDSQTQSEMRKFVAPEFVFGPGALELVGQYAANCHARKVMLVTDPGVARAGWAGVAEKSLREAGIPSVLFDGVSPNPRDHEVMAGVEVYRGEMCDVIVAVGGGSPMDCAKGIGVVACNSGMHILDFEGVDQVPLPGPPMIFIPTTAGTSADISQFAIILDTGRRIKIAIVSKLVIPDVSLIDPRTTLSMDRSLTAATGMDALTHAVEAYVSNAGSPVTDLFALEAVRLVRGCLPETVSDPGNLAARTGMMHASLFAGLAFSNASLGMVHAMAHSLGGLLDSPHGECNAILLEHVVGFNYVSSASKYDRLAELMGVEMASLARENRGEALVRALQSFRMAVGVRHSLRDLGLRPDMLDRLAENAYQDPCLVTNPREASVQEIRECYERAI